MFEPFWRVLRVDTCPSEAIAKESCQFRYFMYFFVARISILMECVLTIERVIDRQLRMDARTHTIYRTHTKLN